jgi:hypothetical protein
MVYQVGLPVVVVAVTSYLVRVKSVVQVVQVEVETVAMDQIHLLRMRRSTRVEVVVVTQVMHHRVGVTVVRVL